MKFLDLFAGIGGIRTGLAMAGHQPIGWVEWDKDVRKSYEAMYDTEGEWTWNDITTIDYRDMPRAGIWTFGFPCQDISLGNNKAKGFKGKRSSLFFAVTKRLRQIKEWDTEKLPSYLLIENVKNFLSVNGGWDFLAAQVELDEIGYDVEWQVLNTRSAGIAQNRERTIIIGHLRGRSTRTIFPLRQDNTATPIQRESGFKIRVNTKKGYDYVGEGDTLNYAFASSKTRRGRVGRGYLQTLDTQCTQAVLDGGRWRRITPREAWRAQGFSDEAYEKAAATGIGEKALYKQAGNSVTVNVIYEIGRRLEQ